MKAKIEVDGVSKVFATPQRRVVAIDDISFSVNDGELVCMLGPSGCGKTTMLNIIGGFERQTTGEVRIAGKPVVKPGPDRGYVFQEHALFPWMTIGENVGFGLLRDAKRTKKEKQEIVEHYLDMVGLKDSYHAYPHELSGGMRQRAAIGRALAPDPEGLLMDEPFAALDAQTRYMMQLELLKIQERAQKTILFVTHSIEEALVLSDRIIVFSRRPARIRHNAPIEKRVARDPNHPSLAGLKSTLYAIIAEEFGGNAEEG